MDAKTRASARTTASLAEYVAETCYEDIQQRFHRLPPASASTHPSGGFCQSLETHTLPKFRQFQRRLRIFSDYCVHAPVWWEVGKDLMVYEAWGRQFNDVGDPVRTVPRGHQETATGELNLFIQGEET
ncbi:MAG: hypothetical protein WAO76_15745 [Georgfuchsia sp.]